MDPDNKHYMDVYNDSNGKAMLVIDQTIYPDESGSYTDTLLLDNESRILRTASLGILNGNESVGYPYVHEPPTIEWNLDEIVTMPFFHVEDSETLSPDEKALVSHYVGIRESLLSSNVSKAVTGFKYASIITWLGFGLMFLGLLAGIIVLITDITPKGAREIGGYVAATAWWCGLYPVWSYLHHWFDAIYGIGFVVASAIASTLFAHTVMNRIESDQELTNNQVKTPFIPAFVISLVVCIIIGFQYAWWASFFGFCLSMYSFIMIIHRPLRCEECHKKGTFEPNGEKVLDTIPYEESEVKGDPVVYRVYYRRTHQKYAVLYRCSVCGHIQCDSHVQDRVIDSEFIRKEYLFTKKQPKPKAQPVKASSDTFPKVYLVSAAIHDYTLTQSSKYSDIDYIDQWGGEWEHVGGNFRLVRRGVSDPNT